MPTLTAPDVTRWSSSYAALSRGCSTRASAQALTIKSLTVAERVPSRREPRGAALRSARSASSRGHVNGDGRPEVRDGPLRLAHPAGDQSLAAAERLRGAPRTGPNSAADAGDARGRGVAGGAGATAAAATMSAADDLAAGTAALQPLDVDAVLARQPAQQRRQVRRALRLPRRGSAGRGAAAGGGRVRLGCGRDVGLPDGGDQLAHLDADPRRHQDPQRPVVLRLVGHGGLVGLHLQDLLTARDLGAVVDEPLAHRPLAHRVRQAWHPHVRHPVPLGGCPWWPGRRPSPAAEPEPAPTAPASRRPAR